MKNIKHLIVVFTLVFMAFSHSVYAETYGEKLFVNITTDNTDRVAMAIGFSTKIRMEKNIPVTIFLNVEGVKIADKNNLSHEKLMCTSLNGHKHSSCSSLSGQKQVSDESFKEMLAGFMRAGGKVIVCPQCMKKVGGLTKDDLIEGVIIGGSDVTWPALFADDTTVLSY
ncbi:MAG: DsrE family protein [Cocleimonas sp.]